MVTDAEPIRKLVAAFKQLPGIGEKTALRLAYHVLKSPREQAENLAQAVLDIKSKIGLCQICFSLTDVQPCRICTDESRTDELVCVVEQPQDIAALEKAGRFAGKYHVLHGALSPLDDIGPEDLKVSELTDRIREGRIKEVILATNPNREGEATASYLADLLRPLGVDISRIAHGISVGADIEYTDEVTLGFALSERKKL